LLKQIAQLSHDRSVSAVSGHEIEHQRLSTLHRIPDPI